LYGPQSHFENDFMTTLYPSVLLPHFPLKLWLYYPFGRTSAFGLWRLNGPPPSLRLGLACLSKGCEARDVDLRCWLRSS
jgi:hypothetical protein